jgi:hypothetical protein
VTEEDDRKIVFETKKIMKIRWITRVKSFICERENFVLNSLINFEPVKRFKNRRNVNAI